MHDIVVAESLLRTASPSQRQAMLDAGFDSTNNRTLADVATLMNSRDMVELLRKYPTT